MRQVLIDLIVDHLSRKRAVLKSAFFQIHSIPVAKHFFLDELLPTELAKEISGEFPKPRSMRLLNSRQQLKLKYSHIKNTHLLIQDLHHAIQSEAVVSEIEKITDIKDQLPDRSKLAGGVSALFKGHYINPHLDNSHDVSGKLYRTVNLLYYVSPNWCLENGGHYELWDVNVKDKIMIPSFFNRLVVMETNETSWHAVSPVLVNEPRCCIFNYYFSPQSPKPYDYFHGPASTFFKPLFKSRPEQKFYRALEHFKSKYLRIK